MGVATNRIRRTVFRDCKRPGRMENDGTKRYDTGRESIDSCEGINMLQLRKLKKEIDEAATQSAEAVDRMEREKSLQEHLAKRLRRVQIELDVITHKKG